LADEHVDRIPGVHLALHQQSGRQQLVGVGSTFEAPRRATCESRPSAPTIRRAVTVRTTPSTATSAEGGSPDVSEINLDGRQTVVPVAAASSIRVSCITG
jgi:hypothetical protein